MERDLPKKVYLSTIGVSIFTLLILGIFLWNPIPKYRILSAYALVSGVSVSLGLGGVIIIVETTSKSNKLKTVEFFEKLVPGIGAGLMTQILLTVKGANLSNFLISIGPMVFVTAITIIPIYYMFAELESLKEQLIYEKSIKAR